VQSAMMKRSDSVSKRWSAQQTPGTLSRQNSLASVRGGLGGLQGSHSMPRLEPTPGSRETSNEPASRPTSSSSNVLPALAGAAQSKADNDGFVKPALPHHNRSRSVASVYTTNAEDSATSPPSSPSKRFSPTKSSWIESALTRPESPKTNTSPTRNSQPSWMANIAKAKAERASAEATPRTGTPKPFDVETPKNGTPANSAPFGQSMLKRSDSRDLAQTPISSTPPTARGSFKLESKPSNVKPETATMAGAEAAEDVDLQKDPAPKPLSFKKSTASTSTPKDEKPAEDLTKSPPSLSSKPAAELTKSPPPSQAAKPAVELTKSPPASLAAKPKVETTTKPQTNFRSTLRSRPPPEAKQQDAPEFLSKFGNLRKTQQEKYVAPDVLKDNITRGKNDLSKTGGPMKTARKDELKESLLAKKEDWKKAKEEGRELPGQIHERKASVTAPVTPSKPEALARRELLAKSEGTSSPEKPKPSTPEALARQRSLQDKPKVEAPPAKHESVTSPQPTKLEQLSKQASAPAELEHKKATETSKLAARFNPGLAGILARGPPAISNPPSRSESPALPDRSSAATPSEPSATGPLQDVRKGRAKGPKKRRPGASGQESPAAEQTPEVAAKDETNPKPITGQADATDEVAPEPPVPSVSKPRALPGSAVSIMMASLKASPKPSEPSALPSLTTSKAKETSALSTAAATTKAKEASELSVKPDTASTVSARTVKAIETPSASPSKTEVPEFGGFKSLEPSATTKADEDKENGGTATPLVRSLASKWGRQTPQFKSEPPAQIQLPSKKDEEAAMRSAGLLASSPGPGRSSTPVGLGIAVKKTNNDGPTPPASAGLPPKPAKSSRVVSGQLQEASPNKG
jgi:hypothetical protein